MEDKHDANTLWVALSEYGEGNVFAVYPKILAELLLQEEAARQQGDTSEAERLVLPSDKEWRLQQYFYLVSLQKGLEDENAEAKKSTEEAPEEWMPWTYELSLKNPNAPPPVVVKTTPGPAWDIRKVLKAAHLLCKPPIKIDFVDEQEMRCVYSLIYDVFRYKSILEQALDDVEFFSNYPDLVDHRYTTWLFLMELARRRWAPRPRGEEEIAASLLANTNPLFVRVEAAIWEQRVHFAAAVARIRIKHKAYSLSELLPPHLREEKISACVNKETVTGWVNTFKAKKVANLVKQLHDLGYSYSNSKQLCAGEYRFDRVCPRFITMRPPANVSVGQIDLVKRGVIVLQEREFCEGASTLCRALRASSLTGAVAQTHASSPRCSAYLAAQLRELSAIIKASKPAAPATPELGRLVVFGAGDKVESYVCALRELGIDAKEAPHFTSSVCVLSEAVHCDAPIVATALDGVVAALATPPNSYSAVTDPIDLVCGRGGDLAMLEILTESEIDSTGKGRVQSILEEQKKTLKTLLSKPQIQLILYETHSAVEAENQTQVTRAVAEANRLARERHSLLRKKHRDVHSAIKVLESHAVESSTTLGLDTIRSELDIKDEKASPDNVVKGLSIKIGQSRSNGSRPPSGDLLDKNIEMSETRPGTTTARPIPELNLPEDENTPKDPDKDWANIHVPNCDLFEIRNLPNLGNGLDINYILDRDGCYLGLIQRKEIVRLDAKYMIRVAEDRGLFGAGTAAQSARQKRKEHSAPEPRRRRKHTGGFEVDRIAAPTYASLTRSTRRGSAPGSLSPLQCGGGGAGGAEGGTEEGEGSRRECSRHARRHAAAGALAALCTCEARHKLKYKRVTSEAPPLSLPSPPCRQPFPLVVHEVRLKNTKPRRFFV